MMVRRPKTCCLLLSAAVVLSKIKSNSSSCPFFFLLISHPVFSSLLDLTLVPPRDGSSSLPLGSPSLCYLSRVVLLPLVLLLLLLTAPLLPHRPFLTIRKRLLLERIRRQTASRCLVGSSFYINIIIVVGGCFNPSPKHGVWRGGRVSARGGRVSARVRRLCKTRSNETFPN